MTRVAIPGAAGRMGRNLIDACQRAVGLQLGAATERAGHRTGPYVGLLDRGDPARGFSSYVGQPRFATGYYPLRHVPSILIENHAYKPYRARVLANRDFLLALFAEVAGDPDGLIEAVGESRRRTVALGRADAASSQVVLGYATAEASDSYPFPVYGSGGTVAPRTGTRVWA